MSETKTPSVEELMKEIEALKAHNAELADAASKGTGVSLPVEGTFTVEGKGPDGKAKKSTYRFKNGRLRVALTTGEQVSSAGLLRLANGKDLTEDDKTYSALVRMSKQDAIDFLTHLCAIQAGVLEIVTD